jgi:hypothetical protein
MLSRIRIFSIPDLGYASKNLSILTQKTVSKFSEIGSGLFIPDPDPDFSPISAPDPVSRIRNTGLKTKKSEITATAQAMKKIITVHQLSQKKRPSAWK